MPVDQAVGLHVRDGRQLAVVERIEEVDRVLDVRLALLRVSHDRAGIAEEVADIAVVLGDQHIDRIMRAVRHPHRRVVAAAVVCPGNSVLIERVPDVAQCRGRDLGTAQDVGCIYRAVRQEAGAQVVDHVEVAKIAVRRRVPGQAGQIRYDRCDAGLSDIRAVGPRLVTLERHIRRRLRVRIRHARCRRLALALERLPEDGVGRPDHLVLDGGTAHDRLVIVVIEGVPVREALEHRCVALLNIQERHRVAPRTVVTRDAHERIQVIEAAGRVVRGRIHHVAVRLLPHVKQSMHHIADIAVVRPGGTGAGEKTVRQCRRIGDARIGREHGQSTSTGAQQPQIVPLQRRLDRRQKRVRHECGIEGALSLVEAARSWGDVGRVRRREAGRAGGLLVRRLAEGVSVGFAHCVLVVPVVPAQPCRMVTAMIAFVCFDPVASLIVNAKSQHHAIDCCASRNRLPRSRPHTTSGRTEARR